jgi:ABC-2 type transport system permease protein
MSPVTGRRRYGAVVAGVAWRNLHNVFTNPTLLLPSLVFPLFFLLAFAGGLKMISQAPGFDFPTGYTAFQFVFVLVQSSAFGGVFTGFSVAADFERGFGRRLLLAAPRRSAIVAGYLLAALVRALFSGSVVFAAALIGGLRVDGSALDFAGLVGLALVVNATAALWALGIALRFRSIQAGPFMQIPVFLILFTAPVYVPLDLLTGWIKSVASVNPMTAVFEAGRGFISGAPTEVVLAFGAIAGLTALFAFWAVRGLRLAEAAG